MSWKGVITNAGNELLNGWTAGKTLEITRAAAGTGRVEELALIVQTALVNQKQEISILSSAETLDGQRISMQITPQAVGYALNQIGVFARLDSGEEAMLALYQTDTDAGVDIPSTGEMADFVYTFYGMLEMANTGTLQVNVDPAALASREMVQASVNAHNEDEEAHADIRQAIKNAAVSVDATLAVAGAAADAKAVGDALGNIAAVLDAINGEVV